MSCLIFIYYFFHRKVELFGRPHNVQPNWVTLGNQLDGIVVHDEEMLKRWNKAYPDGYNITEDIFLHPRQKPKYRQSVVLKKLKSEI